MKDEEILKLAIEKAIKNGWKCDRDRIDTDCAREVYNFSIREIDKITISLRGLPTSTTTWVMDYERVIFSHSFAKAFWGKEEHDEIKCEGNPSGSCRGYIHVINSWQFHLTKMVLEPEPLQYLAKFVKEEGLA